MQNRQLIFNLLPDANTIKQKTERQLDNEGHEIWSWTCPCRPKVSEKSSLSDDFTGPAITWCGCNNANRRWFLLLFRDLVLWSKPKCLCQHAPCPHKGGLLTTQQNLSSRNKVNDFFRMCKRGKWDFAKQNCCFIMLWS